MRYGQDAMNNAAGPLAANYGSNQAANAQLGGPSPIQRPLESIATATQRVNSAIVVVQDFLERWHGPQPANAAGVNAAEPGPCYAGELERLMSAIERLEYRISALDEIG